MDEIRIFLQQIRVMAVPGHLISPVETGDIVAQPTVRDSSYIRVGECGEKSKDKESVKRPFEGESTAASQARVSRMMFQELVP